MQQQEQRPSQRRQAKGSEDELERLNRKQQTEVIASHEVNGNAEKEGNISDSSINYI